ncbi:hypothetical protein [Photobacterium minamisatsumaniensis]
MLIRYEDKTIFIDTSNTRVINGKYLIQFDGLTTINELHRVPAKGCI